MPKINVYLPDHLAEAVKEAGIPVSPVCQRALEQAVRRMTAIRETVRHDLAGDDLRLTHFTERARTVVRLSIERARDESAAQVDTRHLLGSIVAEGENLALRLLTALEIEPQAVTRELGERPAAPTAGVAQAGQHFSTDAAATLELAVAEAAYFGHNYVGTEHLLLGLIAEPDGIAGQLLRSMGAEQRLARHAVAAALSGYVHLQTQSQSAPPTSVPQPDLASLATVIRGELEPLLQRLEQVEQRLTALAGQ